MAVVWRWGPKRKLSVEAAAQSLLLEAGLSLSFYSPFDTHTQERLLSKQKGASTPVAFQHFSKISLRTQNLEFQAKNFDPFNNVHPWSFFPPFFPYLERFELLFWNALISVLGPKFFPATLQFSGCFLHTSQPGAEPIRRRLEAL